jgi:hypothetical protein
MQFSARQFNTCPEAPLSDEKRKSGQFRHITVEVAEVSPDPSH